MPLPHSNELLQSVFLGLLSDDVLRESFYSLILVHCERPEGEDKDMEHLIKNSSDSDDTVNDTDFDDMPTTNLTSSIFQP